MSYNPVFRDKHGCYPLTEWTCPSEIGNVINGKEFTLEEYLQVEDAYVHTVSKFIEEMEIHSLRILQLSMSMWNPEVDKASALYESEFEDVILKEDLGVKWVKILNKLWVMRNLLLSRW